MRQRHDFSNGLRGKYAGTIGHVGDTANASANRRDPSLRLLAGRKMIAAWLERFAALTEFAPTDAQHVSSAYEAQDQY